MTNTEELLDIYQQARQLYINGNFPEADKKVLKYKTHIDYQTLPIEDRRTQAGCILSLIIVSYNQGTELIKCLDSLFSQKSKDPEIVLIDNGKNESIHAELKNLPLLHFQSPINFAPSEARNIGAHFATGDILVFIDDDCIVDANYLESILLAFRTFDFLAIRGRILAKSAGGNTSAPRHYDLGNYPIPAALVTEGNMAVPRDAYRAVGGMHPLMFGLEGVEFTWRLSKHFPDKEIYYWPSMVIRHDHVSWDGRAAKKKRHANAKDYLKISMPEHIDLTTQFARWYDDRPGPYKRYESRSATVRLKHALLDALAAFLYGRKK